MRVWKSVLGLTVVAASFALSGPAWSEVTETRKLIETVAGVKVTIEEAIKTASEKVPGKVVDAELERNRNLVMWEIRVLTAENKLMEVDINAETGAVIAVYYVEAEKAKSGRFKRPRSS